MEVDADVAKEDAAAETFVAGERASLQEVLIPAVIECAVLPPPNDEQKVLQKAVLPAREDVAPLLKGKSFVVQKISTVTEPPAPLRSTLLKRLRERHQLRQAKDSRLNASVAAAPDELGETKWSSAKGQ